MVAYYAEPPWLNVCEYNGIGWPETVRLQNKALHNPKHPGNEAELIRYASDCNAYCEKPAICSKSLHKFQNNWGGGACTTMRVLRKYPQFIFFSWSSPLDCIVHIHIVGPHLQIIAVLLCVAAMFFLLSLVLNKHTLNEQQKHVGISYLYLYFLNIEI